MPSTARRRRRGESPPLDMLRSDLTDSAIVGLYAPKYGGARSSAGVLSVLDDARVSTSTGRYYFPGSGHRIDIGNFPALDGRNSTTVTARITPTVSGVERTIFARYGTTLATQQLRISLTNGGSLICRIGDGVAVNYGSTPSTIDAGTTWDIAVVYNGTGATNADRLKMYRRSFDPLTQTWSATNVEVLAFSGTIPATLITPAATDLIIGGQTSLTDSWQGFLDNVGMTYIAALSQAQVESAWEGLTSNLSLYWSFSGNANNSGPYGGGHGIPTSQVIQASDDLRWGPPLVGVGTGRPAYDSATGIITFDGVDDYLRGDGGLFSRLTSAGALVHIGAAAASGRHCDLSAGAGTSALRIVRNLANIDATANSSLTAQASHAAGLRVHHARRSGTGTVTVGARVGAGAEVTASAAVADVTASRLTVGAAPPDVAAAFGSPTALGLIVYAGNYASGTQYEAVNRFGQSLGATV